MRYRLKAQNYYVSSLASFMGGISSTGAPNDEFEFQVQSPPSVSSGYLIVEFEDPTKRDLIFFHNVIGNSIKYYRKNRDLLGNGSLSVNHDEQSSVQMNDFSEWFNHVSYNTDDRGMVQHIGNTPLHVSVLGGFVNHFGTIINVPTTNLLIPISSTNQIVFDFSDNTFKSVTTPTATQYIVAEIVTNSTTVTTITDKRGQVISPLFDTTEFEVASGVLRIKDGAIDTNEIANGAVTSAKIAGGAVGTTEIANNAVTSAEIAGGAVTSDKLASNLNLAGYVDLDETTTPSTPVVNKARIYVKEVGGKETLRLLNSSGDDIQIGPTPGFTPIVATKVGPITWTPSGATLTITDPSCTVNSVVMNVSISSGTPNGIVFEADTQAGQVVFTSRNASGGTIVENGVQFFYTIVY